MKIQHDLVNWMESVLTQHIYSYFRFGGHHIAFWLSVDVGGIDDESIEPGDPENLGIAVGTACPSVVEREI